MQSYNEIISQQQNLTGQCVRGQKFIDSHHPALCLSSVPVVNDDYGMTGELSRSSKLPNSFMDRSRWLGARLYENILQGG